MNISGIIENCRLTLSGDGMSGDRKISIRIMTTGAMCHSIPVCSCFSLLGFSSIALYNSIHTGSLSGRPTRGQAGFVHLHFQDDTGLVYTPSRWTRRATKRQTEANEETKPERLLRLPHQYSSGGGRHIDRSRCLAIQRHALCKFISNAALHQLALVSPCNADASSQVGHDQLALTEERTLESLYLNPILDTLNRQNPESTFPALSIKQYVFP